MCILSSTTGSEKVALVQAISVSEPHTVHVFLTNRGLDRRHDDGKRGKRWQSADRGHRDVTGRGHLTKVIPIEKIAAQAQKMESKRVMSGRSRQSVPPTSPLMEDTSYPVTESSYDLDLLNGRRSPVRTSFRGHSEVKSPRCRSVSFSVDRVTPISRPLTSIGHRRHTFPAPKPASATPRPRYIHSAPQHPHDGRRSKARTGSHSNGYQQRNTPEVTPQLSHRRLSATMYPEAMYSTGIFNKYK